ncbi:30S ribosomal protein S3 [Candidatus Woesearchaeota archaeon]|nr:30S ribosomal protein S3 [Candidatus Woesearchaeota archaeon]
MIERQFIKERLKEFEIEKFIYDKIPGAGFSHTKVVRTPLGDKIIIYAAKPGLVVGRKGENIRNITEGLSKKFKLENPQVEIAEIEEPMLNARVVAEKIKSALEKFGLMRFKRIGYSMLEAVMGSGALGVEILISGRIPSARARTWRFYQGYLKKSGTTSYLDVDKATTRAELKTGTVGIKVRIMPPDTKLPDDIRLIGEEETEVAKRVEAAKAAVKLPKISEEGEEEIGAEKAILIEEEAEEHTEEAAEKPKKESKKGATEETGSKEKKTARKRTVKKKEEKEDTEK